MTALPTKTATNWKWFQLHVAQTTTKCAPTHWTNVSHAHSWQPPSEGWTAWGHRTVTPCHQTKWTHTWGNTQALFSKVAICWRGVHCLIVHFQEVIYNFRSAHVISKTSAVCRPSSSPVQFGTDHQAMLGLAGVALSCTHDAANWFFPPVDNIFALTLKLWAAYNSCICSKPVCNALSPPSNPWCDAL